MSKAARRRLFASLRNVAFVALLSAALVGSVGCAGGSNPFCCDSKEKSQIDQNLERAQSLDEREENSTPNEENSDVKEEGEKKTIHANILPTDGSGDAPQLADATTNSSPKTFAQETPVTVSTTAAATLDAPTPPTSAQETPAPNAESAGLLQAPVLPSTSQTSQPAPAAPSGDAALNENATEAQEATNETPNQSADAPETPTPASDSSAAENASNESQEEQTTPEETSTQDAEKTPETQKEKAPETPIGAARSPRRGGPQRAATRQVAQRAANRPVAVPQTRAASTLDAPTPVVTFRTRAVVPAAASSSASTPVVKFRARTVVP